MKKIKRIYDTFEKEDGYRVLVDRLWPRGVSKEDARVDLWMKEIAPSSELRKWFGHDPEKWDEFQKKYVRELDGKKEILKELRQLLKKHKRITLLYGARDTEHNQAVVLLDVL